MGNNHFSLSSVQNAYLPTMPEDMLPEARRIVTGGQFYGESTHTLYIG